MFFQRVLKGVADIDEAEADAVLRAGILCNWWRRVHQITPDEIFDRLTERNLDWHLNHYDDPDPTQGHATFSENTPFISVTAGVVEREEFARRNVVFDPFITALQFATQNFATSGFIFYAYVFTLGRQSLELSEFSEEVRELNIYKHYLPFHPEGEITSKIEIRAPCVEKWEQYDGRDVLTALSGGQRPRPLQTRLNTLYSGPEQYCNIRGLVTD